MRVFEIIIAQSAISEGGAPFVPGDRLFYWIPDDAEARLEPILAPYGQSPTWYFDLLNFGNPPAPWAIACLDREYPIAEHIKTSRTPDAGIKYAPYSETPEPLPLHFVPGVGVLLFFEKHGLERCAEKSPIFSSAWRGLRECSSEKRWLAILEPLSPDWLATLAQNRTHSEA